MAIRKESNHTLGLQHHDILTCVGLSHNQGEEEVLLHRRTRVLLTQVALVSVLY